MLSGMQIHLSSFRLKYRDAWFYVAMKKGAERLLLTAQRSSELGKCLEAGSQLTA